MPDTPFDQPINEADRRAREAFRAVHENVTGEQTININPRTYERILAGKRDVPPGVARELAEFLRCLSPESFDGDAFFGWIDALEAWSDDCQRRSAEAHHA